MESRVHVGFNIYYGNQGAQNHFLVACLGPSMDEARSRFPVQFWFDRFDARGPHIFLLMTILKPYCEEARAFLSSRFSCFLAAGSNPEPVSAEEAKLRNNGCRGKWLCAVDREPGMATDNSYYTFEQPADGYPFFLSRGLDHEEELWRLLDSQTTWAIKQLALTLPKPATAVGVLWLAALDRLLANRVSEIDCYWSYHATTLLPSLASRLAERPQDTYSNLLGAIGARNLRSFEVLWEREAANSMWPYLSRLLDCVIFEHNPPRPQPWALLREVVHTTLKQLGIATQIHIPLLLFAWSRHLPVPYSSPDNL